MNNGLKNSLRATLVPLLASLIWGVSFVAQKLANTCGAFTVNALRSFIAVFFLLILTAILTKCDFIYILSEREKACTKTLWLGGILAGSALFVATFLQQQGMNMGVDAGKSGFLTTLYVVMVPVFGIFVGKKPTFKIWISVILALIGLYLLCIDLRKGFSVEPADITVIVCGLFYAVQILFLDRFSKDCNSTKLSAVMFLTCGVLSGIAALIFDRGQSLENILGSALPILYLGVFSSGIAYTLQVVAQKSDAHPAVVTVLLSMESVFSVLAGAFILNEKMTLQQYVGCAVMLAAVMLNVLLTMEKPAKK